MYKEEKRCFRRVELNAPVRYEIRGRADFGNTLTDNISEGGVAINSPVFIAPATPLKMEINILNRVLHPLGKVCWCQPLPHSSSNRLGVEFLEFEPLERGFLKDFVNMKLV